MVWSQLVLICMLGTMVSWLTIAWLIHSKYNAHFISDAQPHHTHVRQTSRVGGIGIICGFLSCYWLFYYIFGLSQNANGPYAVVLLGALFAFVLGLVDDIKSIDARFKFLIQILIAVISHEYGLSIDRIDLPFLEWNLDLSNWSLVLTVFWFVSIMNLVNLIDGLDGLAGGIGFMLMVLLVVLGMGKSISLSVFLSLGMAGAILGFLIHNFPPAKVYMGDSGAYTIGYVIAALSLMNFQKGAVIAALIGPMIALALPIIDVLFAIIRRFVQGLPIFRPDKEHIHHQLMRSGLSHKNTVLVLYGISLVALAGGILVYSNQGRYFPLFIGFLMVAVIFLIRVLPRNPFEIKRALFDSLESRSEIQNYVRLSRWLVAEVDQYSRSRDLWEDYQFFLKKLGFVQVMIEIDGVKKEYYMYPNTLDSDVEELLKSQCYPFDSKNTMNKMQYFSDGTVVSQRRFILLCEIAHETWTLAIKRWKALNRASFQLDFD